MQRVIYTSLFFVMLLLSACHQDKTIETKVLSDEEQAIADSLSRMVQKTNADSMKKLNPLLIMPPDSNYTGEYTDKYPNGIIKFKGFYRFGKMHGQWMSFYPSGLAWSELHYDKGLRHGPNITYFTSGQKRYEGFYKDDRQDSTWSYFDTTGKLSEKVVFKNSKIVRKLPLK